jgi:hypothetical protein
MSHLITERAYWRDPVQVFGGMTWLVLGFFVGIMVA